MRDKVIARLKKIFDEQDGYVGAAEFLSFDMPQSKEEIETLTDEQLIDLLETNGMFEG